MNEPRVEDLVISGISGRFPESNNVEELKQNLLNGIDLVTKKDGLPPNIAPRMGKLKNLERFDATFFGIFPNLAHTLDPQLRVLMEVSFEALMDAGVNPNEVRGSNTGVYIGSCTNHPAKFGETQHSFILDTKSMLANRVSYVLDLKGPSACIDTACSSSLAALHIAVNALRSNDCDAALVGGCNLCLGPASFTQYSQLNLLSPDGKCKFFDAAADGFVRSEAAAVIYIQKAQVARRIYASIVGTTMNNDGYKEEGAFVPSGASLLSLTEKLYANLGIDPRSVGYVEAHGPGTLVGDPQEGYALSELFSKDRDASLLVGSVKTNLGHAEGAAGICSIAKVVIAMESGVIPGNLHFRKASEQIPSLLDGRLKVVTTNQPLTGSLVGINSMGIGGVNVHVLLRLNQKDTSTKPSIPRLVTVSARTVEGVLCLLKKAEIYKNEPDLFALYDKIFACDVKGFEARGYKIIGEQTQEISTVPSKKRPLWFVYSGMGSQWSGMAKDMMQLDTFQESVTKSANILKKYGVDLMELLLNSDESVLENILNLIVCITAVQIALTDVLKMLGVLPDGIIGHSVGETACAYADGCLTAEQTIKAAYLRGKAFQDTHLLPGAMAAVDLPWHTCQKRCPPGIYPACNNSKHNVTVSGLQNDIHDFVAQLQQENIFAKVVKGPAQAFHCPHVANAAPKLLHELHNLIPTPKQRSTKWITSSVPKHDWKLPESQQCSPEYLVNNLKSPVLFHEARQFIPDNAIVVEIAPHGLMQPFLESTNTIYLSLMTRKESDTLKFCLGNLGRLYNAGFQLELSKLYGTTFPVARGTPMIAPLVKWDHSETWKLTDHFSKSPVGTVVTVDLEKDEFLNGHIVDGVVLYPAAGYLVNVWEVFANLLGENFERVAVAFEDVKFHQATPLSKEEATQFVVNIFDGSGCFEITEKGTPIVSGKIMRCDCINEFKPLEESLDNLCLYKDDVYKLLRLGGYHYEGLFRGILKTDYKGCAAQLEWANNWTVFIDAVLQLYIIGENMHQLLLPTGIRRVVLDPVFHFAQVAEASTALPASKDAKLQMVQSGGVKITGIRGAATQRRDFTDLPVTVAAYAFVPLMDASSASELEAFRMLSQIVIENFKRENTVKIVELNKNSMVKFKPILEEQKFAVIEYTVDNSTTNHAHLVIIHDPLALAAALACLQRAGFVLLIYNAPLNVPELETISHHFSAETKKHFILLRQTYEPHNDCITLEISNDFAWVEPLKDAMEKSESEGTPIYLLAKPQNGAVGLVNCLLHEPGGKNLRTFVLDENADAFSPTSDFYSTQIKKNLVHNVLDASKNWGTYRHVVINPFKPVVVEEAFLWNTPGNLGSLKWVQNRAAQRDSKQEVCTIEYAALNFHDVLVASGRIPSMAKFEDLLFGWEFSGRDSDGRRVMGVFESGCLSSKRSVNKDVLLEVPEEWSLEDAATVYSVYATCYYALLLRGQLQHGETVLIHTGTGGVGIAAIRIALHMGCTVFTTVSTPQKKAFLKEHFPLLDDCHIGNSRDATFEKMVMTHTKGRGVDLVLNSLSGELQYASLRCVANPGRFIEIGKYDLLQNSPLGMSTFLNNKSFMSIDMNDDLNEVDRKNVKRAVLDGIRQGVVKPLPRRVFDADDIENAFRFMSSGRHIGKVVVRLQRTITATPRTYFDPSKSYLIVGGLGGFGIEVVNWMISRGATTVIITSRTGASTGYQTYRINAWQEQNVNVVVSTLNAANPSDALKLLEMCDKLAPLGGVFNVAMVLHDAVMKNQSVATFTQVAEPKIGISTILDRLTRKYATLDYFVVFSSAVSGIGYAGESNYAYANAAVEQICASRYSNGYPALAIQWGIVGDVGYVVETTGKRDAEILSLRAQPLTSCLAHLDVFLQQNHPVVASFLYGSKQLAETPSAHPLEMICKLLGVKDVTAVPRATTLGDFGIDSLVSIGIRNALEKHYNIIMTVQQIRLLTFEDLGKLTKSGSNSLLNFEIDIVPTQVLVEMSYGGPVVFAVHPGDGTIKTLKNVCAFIQASVYGLQNAEGTPNDSITSMAEYYVRQVKKVQQKGPFLFVGYSLGACIAFEMGLQLEKQGERVVIFMIDGCHNILSLIHDNFMKNNAVVNFSTSSGDYSRSMHYNKLNSIEDLEKRIDYVFKIISLDFPYDVKDTRSAISGWLYRLKAGLIYNPKCKFNGNVMLFRTKDTSFSLENDYGLGSVCKKDVVVHALDGNHDTIVEGQSGLKIAEKINEVLKGLNGELNI